MLIRTLPRRVQPQEGESLESWVDRYCTALSTPRKDFYRAVGLLDSNDGGFSLSDMTLHITADLASRLSAATGVKPSDIRLMTLQRYEGRVIVLGRDRRGVDVHRLWARGRGSRFCPQCLRANPGVWRTAWRLSWSFVCLTHACLLNDVCPVCGGTPKMKAPRRNEVPVPNMCGARAKAPGGTARYCRCDLSDAPSVMLGPWSQILTTQKWLNILMDSEEVSAARVQRDLCDLKLLAARASEVLSADELRGLIGTDDREDTRFSTDAERRRNGLFHPATAIQTAHTVTLAARILLTPAPDGFAPLLGKLLVGAVHAPPSGITSHWGIASPELGGKMLKAVHTTLGPLDALRYGTAGSSPSEPLLDEQSILTRARSVPQRFWPRWTHILHLDPSLRAESLQVALSIGVLVPGYKRHDLGTQLKALDLSKRRRQTFSHVFATMDQGRRDAILMSLYNLADYLDRTPAPVDYAARRKMSLAGLLPGGVWRRIIAEADDVKGMPAAGARLYLRYRLTESLPEQLRSAHYALQIFLISTSPWILDALDAYAASFLIERGINEPLSWEPPIECIDPAARAARTLEWDGVPKADCLAGRGLIDPRLVLRAHSGTAKSVGALLAKDNLETSIKRAFASGASIEEMAKSFRKSTSMIRWHLERLGLPPSPGDNIRFDSERLERMYLTQRRTLPEIAQKTGWSTTTVRNVLVDTGVSRRSRGSHSGSIGVEAELLETAPALLRSALTDPWSRQRLERFVAISSFPTMGEAVRVRQLNLPALSRQLKRLEADVGGLLLIRAKGHQPMRVTALGRKLKRQAHKYGVIPDATATVSKATKERQATLECGGGKDD